MRDVYLVSAARTPIGSFLGSLSTVPAVKLGTVVINGVLGKINLSADKVQDIYMGSILQRENKFQSGLEAIIAGIKVISSGDKNIIVAGGMGSSSLDKESQQIENQLVGGFFDDYAIENNISREEQDKYAI